MPETDARPPSRAKTGGTLTLLGDNRAGFRGLETFPASAGLSTVRLSSDEVTALCPVTGQPDWYRVSASYAPADACVESKSFKLFLNAFRDQGVFCEDLACRVHTALVAACAPVWCEVTVTQKSRGGVVVESVSRSGESPPAR